MPCELCDTPGGDILWQDKLCRVVSVEMPDYPGFCRVILNRHVAEMSDLPEAEQHRLMHVVFALETALRRLMHPDKVNLASLGNVVPHVHWHVIPRFADDAHFPQPIWAVPLRAGMRHSAPDREMLRTALSEALSPA
ncbi:MAG: HIT family protein [Burkholderiales bacterium]|nr:HIT family protein [Burkholderiales bacterium]